MKRKRYGISVVDMIDEITDEFLAFVESYDPNDCACVPTKRISADDLKADYAFELQPRRPAYVYHPDLVYALHGMFSWN